MINSLKKYAKDTAEEQEAQERDEKYRNVKMWSPQKGNKLIIFYVHWK